MNSHGQASVPSLSLERVRQIFDRFKSTRVIVLGDVMLDVYLRGSVDRISPEAPVPVLKVNGESKMLGGAANVANNIVALGGEPILVGVVGDDDAGNDLKAILRDLGISDAGLIVDGSRPTTRKTRVLANKQQVVRVDREECRDVDPRTSRELLGYLEGAISECDALLFQDYNKGVLAPPVITGAVSMATRERKIVTVDPKFHNFFEYKGATLFKPNIREMEYAFGSVKADGRDLERMMAALKERVQSKHVLLTSGESGMTLLDEEGRFYRIPSIAHEVYDVSGAGDTVISAVTLSLAVGGDVRESAVLANYAASIEIQRSGVSTVTAEEIIMAMQRDEALY